jgi:hypothetical protein
MFLLEWRYFAQNTSADGATLSLELLTLGQNFAPRRKAKRGMEEATC